jgi:hypothetical protein
VCGCPGAGPLGDLDTAVTPKLKLLKCAKEGCVAPVFGFRINRNGEIVELCVRCFELVYMCHEDSEQRMRVYPKMETPKPA